MDVVSEYRPSFDNTRIINHGFSIGMACCFPEKNTRRRNLVMSNRARLSFALRIRQLTRDRLSSRFLVLINREMYVPLHHVGYTAVLSCPVQNKQKSNMPRPTSLPCRGNPPTKSKKRRARWTLSSALPFSPSKAKQTKKLNTKLENARPI